MKLSEIIIDYRNRMNISQREFSRRCGLSNVYISYIEKELNPKTQKPLIPTIEQYKKIADGLGLTLQGLFEILDDAPVDLSTPVSSDPFGDLKDDEKRLVTAYRGATASAREIALETLENHQEKKDSSADQMA
jgi:transcriptional regulator with XRE-family HTH domain